MAEIIICPVPETRIKINDAASAQHQTIKTAHLYSFLALLICKQNIGNWSENETLWFGAYSAEKKNAILSYLEETIQWYENTLAVYELATSYHALEFPDIYTIINDTQRQQGQQCPTRITIYTSDQFWHLNQDNPATQDQLAVSIFHSIATFAGLPVKWGVYSESDARQFAQFDPDQTIKSAANYNYYLKSQLSIARELVEVYYCTFRSINCEHPSEHNQWGEQNDEIFIKKNGSKTWPEASDKSITSGQSLAVNQEFTTNIIQADTFELWDRDSVSSNDLLYTFKLKPDSRIFAKSRNSSTEKPFSEASAGEQYAFFGKKSDSGQQAYWMLFSLDRKCLTIVTPQPVEPPTDIVHDEL